MHKTILHIVNLDTVGGVEQLFVNFLEQAQRALHEIYITGDPIHEAFLSRINKTDATIHYEKYNFGMKLPRFLRSFKRRHLFGRDFSSIVLWNRLDKIETTRKLVYYEHGASWMERKSEKFDNLFSAIDLVLANSLASKRLLELKWKLTKPIQIVENPLRPDLEIAKRSRRLTHVPFRIGFIGRLIPLKGCALAIEALRILKARGHDVELSIAGTGPEKAKLSQRAENLPVFFFGTVLDITSFYDSIDLLLIPSIREPLGLVALEAQARGCPVIASAVDGLAEATSGIKLTPKIPLFSYPDYGGSMENLPDFVYDPITDSLEEPCLIDPGEMADAIEQLMKNRAEYERQSRVALDFTNKRKNFSSYVEKLLTFIA